MAALDWEIMSAQSAEAMNGNEEEVPEDFEVYSIAWI